MTGSFTALLLLIYPGIMIRHFRPPRNIIETVPGNFKNSRITVNPAHRTPHGGSGEGVKLALSEEPGPHTDTKGNPGIFTLQL